MIKLEKWEIAELLLELKEANTCGCALSSCSEKIRWGRCPFGSRQMYLGGNLDGPSKWHGPQYNKTRRHCGICHEWFPKTPVDVCPGQCDNPAYTQRQITCTVKKRLREQRVEV